MGGNVPAPVSRAETIGTKLRRLANAARISNPWDNALASGVTVTTSTTHDATLTNSLIVPTNDASFSYHGGTKTRQTGQPYNLFPVANVAPANGGLAGYLPGTPTLNQWTYEVEFITDAPILELKYLGFPNQTVNVIVDGQLVGPKTGIVGATNTGVVQYAKLDFGGIRKARHFRFRGNRQIGWGGVAFAPGHSVWLADQSDVIQVAYTGDSYIEGQGLVSPVNPDGPWPIIASHLLGWRDPRQVALGSTGYLNNAAGTRSTIRQQIPNWGFTPDVIVCAGGFNDVGNIGNSSITAAQLQAEALLAFQSMRAAAPLAPMFITGVWGGSRNLSAATLSAEGAVQSAFLQFNDPRAYYIPVSADATPFLTGTGTGPSPAGNGNADFYMSSDATHPNDAGHEHLERRFANSVRNVIASLAI